MGRTVHGTNRPGRKRQHAENKPIRHVVCAGALSMFKATTVLCANSQCALSARETSIRPNRLEVTNVFMSDRARKLRCRNGL